MRRGYTKTRRSHADGGSSWISYSDMMAALILLFVLVLSYAMYQYYSMLDSKTAELENQAALLSTQAETLTQQQTEIDDKKAMLTLRENELEDAKTELAKKETLLSTQQQALTAQESIINATRVELSAKEEELSAQALALQTANDELKNNQLALASTAAQLESNRQELAAATAKLDEQQQTMQAQQKRLDQLVGIRTQIVRELTDALQKSKIVATVDRNTGDIVLESSVFFDVGKSTIKEEGRAFLERFIPVYLDVLLKPGYSDYLGEIIIEGHTDTSGTYLMNLELSQNRALIVARYCLEMDFLSTEQRQMLQKILTAKGRSFSDPILKADGSEDMDASRRVEFKFRMKDSEMIDEIRDILAENQ